MSSSINLIKVQMYILNLIKDKYKNLKKIMQLVKLMNSLLLKSKLRLKLNLKMKSWNMNKMKSKMKKLKMMMKIILFKQSIHTAKIQTIKMHITALVKSISTAKMFSTNLKIKKKNLQKKRSE
jgi:hypothetical protein